MKRSYVMTINIKLNMQSMSQASERKMHANYHKSALVTNRKREK